MAHIGVERSNEDAELGMIEGLDLDDDPITTEAERATDPIQPVGLAFSRLRVSRGCG